MSVPSTPASSASSAPILLGILDPEAETALLDHAARLATAWGRPLRLVHVVQASIAFGDPVLGLPGAKLPQSMMIDDSAIGRLTEQRLSEATNLLREAVAGAVEVSGELLRGHAAHVLIEQSQGAHRVVLQRRRFSRIHRVFTGSISARVAAHAHCPVTVIPEGWLPEGHSGVVVGISGDKPDKLLLGHALGQAALLDEPVTALHSLELLAIHQELADQAIIHDWTTRSERYLADLVEKFQAQTPDDTRAPLQSQVLAEAPADALVAASEAASLIVVGRGSHLAFPHLGGVTRALLREAACPVDVVPLP